MGRGRSRGRNLPPYAPVKGVREFFERVTARQAPNFIGKDYLVAIGVAASNEQHLVATLKSLGFLDSEGRPTQYFADLYLKGPDRRRRLQYLIRLAYPGIFGGELDLQKATRAEIHDHFVRRYALQGQMARKATALFGFLCTIAGIPISSELAPSDHPSPAERPLRGARRGLHPPTQPSSDPESTPAGVRYGAMSGSALPIAAMVTPEMSEDEIVAFLDRIRRAVERAAESGKAS